MSGDDGGFKKASVILGNYLTSDLQNLLTQKSADVSDMRITPENMAELIKMIYNNEISSRAAKDILARMFADGSDPSTIVQEGGLKQVSDAGTLEVTVKKIIEENPKLVTDYKNGKEAVLQVLVGKVMKETNGAANPEVVRGLLTNMLE
ncbi:MAG: aspartyl-tRNA(Asn)/glutamyl-tRNA (Gln) amidotransferase subunit B [Parcubacteria group bacterium Gr01-1014_29]|nr:MAG: aspartyl-tRNA(Asn)/glutamyl-tRNA (Gln) amidotransferase subunit B [Parcubacteria group bacterium Gr01-1014_29]